MTAILYTLQIDGIAETIQSSPLLAVAGLFLAGVLSSLLPCMYPMIPITASVLAGVNQDGKQSRFRTVTLTLTYVVGLASFYAALGVLAGMTGTIFGTVSASPWALLAVGNLLLLFGLAMLAGFSIRVPAGLMKWAGSRDAGTYPAVFVLGASSGIVAAPCGAPAFAAVLTWVAATGSPMLGFVYLFTFSLGMTAILVVVGLFSGFVSALPRAGNWMLWIKRVGGVVMLVMAEYYLVRAGYSM